MTWPQTGAGIPDTFARLWMPHRMAYLKGENKPTGSGEGESCPFCRAPALSDEEGLIVARGRFVFTVLNLYPYNGGHILVCPYRHVADYTELDAGETAELADHTKRSIRALRTASNAQGFNVGMNLGGVAGAGIAAHLHQHVVPRWGGDTNFMPVVGQTRVLPELLRDTRKLLAEAWRLAAHRPGDAPLAPPIPAAARAAAPATRPGLRPGTRWAGTAAAVPPSPGACAQGR